MSTATAYASNDNWLDNNQPTKNWNNQLGFVRTGDQGGGDGARSIFRITMPSDPGGGVVITKIEFTGIAYNNNATLSNQVDIYYGTNTPATSWVDSQSTWNIYSTGNNWTTAGGVPDFPSTIVDSRAATYAANDQLTWVLYGSGSTNPISVSWGDTVNLMLRSPSSTGYQCDIKHVETTGTANDPRLVVTYEVAPDTNAIFAFGGM